MKESYGEGIADHTGSEPCVGLPRGGGEALVGVRAGRVLSCEIYELQGADAISTAEGDVAGSVSQEPSWPCAVEDPEHARKHLAREPGDPTTAWGRKPGRIGKSEDVSR